MSHWLSGKMDLTCSMAVLRKALLNIMPEWDKYMQTSNAGDLPISNTYTGEKRSGYHLTVSVNAPKIRFADIGFKRSPDGTWITDIDEHYLSVPDIDTLQGAIKKEVGAMKAQAQALAKGGKVVGIQKSKGKITVRVQIPVEDKYKIRA